MIVRQAAEEYGGEALVDRLGPGAAPDLAARMLGDVVLVEGWSNGWKLVQRHPLLRAVTPEGDVISVHGMRLADADGAGHAALEAATVASEVAQKSQLLSILRQEIQSLEDVLVAKENDAQQVTESRKWRSRATQAIPKLTAMKQEIAQLSELVDEVNNNAATAGTGH